MNAFHHLISSTLVLHSALRTATTKELHAAHMKLSEFKSEDPEDNQLLLSIQDEIKVQLSRRPPSPQ